MAHWPTAYPKIVTQPFGPSTITVEPKQYGYKDGGGWLKSYPTAFPGCVPTPYLHYHRAVDLRAYEGTPLYAWQPGTVTKVYTSVSGIIIVLVQIKPGTVYGYYHCSKVLVTQGQKVAEGQTIALAGHTGATAAHLHMILQLAEKQSDGVTRTMNYNPLRFLPGGDLALDPRVAVMLGNVTPTVPVVNIRKEPAAGATPILGTLATGAKLAFADIVTGPDPKYPTWYRCFYGGGWGYISTSVAKVA